MKKRYKVRLKKEYKNKTTEKMNKKFLSSQELLNKNFKLVGKKSKYDDLLNVIFGE